MNSSDGKSNTISGKSVYLFSVHFDSVYQHVVWIVYINLATAASERLSVSERWSVTETRLEGSSSDPLINLSLSRAQNLKRILKLILTNTGNKQHNGKVVLKGFHLSGHTPWLLNIVLYGIRPEVQALTF